MQAVGIDHHPITADKLRGLHPGGGMMATYDPVGRGRVQFLDVPGDDVVQGVVAVDELVRISRLDPDFSWSRTTIISRDWRRLGPMRAYAAKLGLQFEMANAKLPRVWRPREMQNLLAGWCQTNANQSPVSLPSLGVRRRRDRATRRERRCGWP
ncbi:MAG: hypothetical protein Q8K08_01770 [Pseudotabrizicola sp.]|nr:hypothetical protein [Pseudotabrizicola sp.]